MDNPTISRVIEILQNDPDFFVPVKKLWLTVQGEGLSLDTEMDEFHLALSADERFEFAPGVDHREGFEDSPEDAEKMEREMESLGFYGGPRVKLVSREMTVDDIFSAMSRSLARMNEALQNAWEVRPEGDQDTEDQMIEILAAGQKLEREIQELIEQPKPDEE
jgi:hypothetical protein